MEANQNQNKNQNFNSLNQTSTSPPNPSGNPPNIIFTKTVPGALPPNLSRFSNNQQNLQPNNPYIQPTPQQPASFQQHSNSFNSSGAVNYFKNHKKYFLIFSIFILAIIFLGGIAWAFDKYETYGRKIPLEKILPGDSDLVLKVSINPEAEQFNLLEKNMEKFPGYKQLRMSLDESGQAKSFSELFQNKLKEYNLDFQKDIKPVLGDNAYVIVPDMNPLGKNLYSDGYLGSLNFKEMGKKMAELQKTNPLFAAEFQKENGNVAGEEQEKKETAMAGYEDNYYGSQYRPEQKKIEKMDFIVASEIKDLKKAKEVIDKLRGNLKYEVAAENYKGYQYYKIKYKSSSSSGNGESLGDLFNHDYTFHSMIGKNWVSTSSESYIKSIIDRRAERHIVRALFSEKIGSFLADNADYQKVVKSLNDSKENLLTLYYNINFEEFFKKDCRNEYSCFSMDEYVRYPSNIIDGFSIKIEDSGFKFTHYANDIAANQYKNVSLQNSLAKKIPQKIDNRWTDAFYEINDFKDLYYNYKNNRLTDKGSQGLSRGYSDFEKEIGVHPERDIIDNMTGNVAFVMLSEKNVYPEGAMIAEISSSEAMSSAMKKMIEGMKKVEIQYYESRVKSFEAEQKTPYYQKMSPEMKSLLVKENQIAKEMIDALKNSNITETSLPEGKIYSYKLPQPKSSSNSLLYNPSISFDYSLENNQFIISTNYSVVESMLKELKNNSAKKLAESDYYKTGSKFFYSDVSSNMYLNSLGIWNSVDYYYQESRRQQLEYAKKQCEESKKSVNKNQSTYYSSEYYCNEDQMKENWKKEDDQFFAVGSVIRTLQILAAASTLGQDSSQSTFYMHVQEIPQDEKERASRIFDGM
jgi:hypothetical protein